jgi:hypothetical protein
LLSAKDPMQNMQVTHAPTSSEHWDLPRW